MTTRTVAVRLQALNQQFDAAYKNSGKNVRELQGELTRASKNNSVEMERMGRGALISGAAIVGGLGLATNAAMNWETAWAGVTKTVDGTTSQMASLEEGLRGLATTLPATHGEIAAVAEAAGQLGIAREDIVGFTRTMVDLGETTNLSADEAATSIAQLMNVMQTAPEDVGRLGATLVALGNAGASTERDIIQMAQRISGAAAIVGLSEGEVLAFANTVASMGIEVEAGGTSVSRVLTGMSKAAQDGGEELAVFAKTAGMSAQQFSTAFQDKPAEAFAAFIKGLGGVQEAGGNVFAILDQIGLSDVRVSQALLGMATSGDMLQQSLDLQSQAWQENNALVEEAAKRYDTSASRIRVSMNKINDAAIDMGGTLLPALVGVGDVAGSLAGTFSALPDPMQKTATIAAALAGSAALLGGGFLVAAPRIAETRAAIETLGKTAPRSTRALTAMGSAAGKAGLAFGVLATAAAVFGADRGDMARFGAEVEAAAGSTTQAKIEGLTKRMKELREFSESGIDTNLGFTRVFWDDFGKGTSDAADKADLLEERIKQLKSELKVEGLEAKAAGKAAGEFGTQVDAAGNAVAGATQEVEEYADALDRLNGINISAAQSTLDLKKQKQDMNKATRTGGKVTDDETEALLSFAAAANDTAKAIEEQTGSAEEGNVVLRQSRRAFIEAAVAAGHTRTEAKELAQQFFNMPDAKPKVRPEGMTAALSQGRSLRQVMDGVSGTYPVVVTYSTRGQIPSGISVRQLMGGADGGQLPYGLADGGMIPRWMGGPREDNVVIAAGVRASGGEYVVNEPATRANLAILEAINSGARLTGVADGGFVGSVRPAAQSGGGIDSRALARAIRSELEGLTVVMDGQTVGRIQGRQADLYRRAG